MRQIIVECPRCGKKWRLPLGSPGIECTCHLYCPYGTKPQDCNVTEVNYSGKLNWPTGLHNDPEQEGEDILHRTYYCSTHDVYYYKTPIWIEADSQKWFSRRAPKKHRMSKAQY